MFEWIARIIRQARRRGQTGSDSSRSGLPPGVAEDRVITSSLEKNQRILRQIFDHDEELVFREIQIGKQKPVPAYVVFIDSLIRVDLLQRGLLRDLLQVEQVPADAIPWLKEKVTSPAEIEPEDRWVKITERISRGYAVLFVEGQDEALATRVMVEGPPPGIGTHKRDGHPRAARRLRGRPLNQHGPPPQAPAHLPPGGSRSSRWGRSPR